MFGTVTFGDLKTLYGNEVAHSLLVELEQHVKLNSDRLAAFDPEKRMQLVFDIIESENLEKTERHSASIHYIKA